MEPQEMVQTGGGKERVMPDSATMVMTPKQTSQTSKIAASPQIKDKKLKLPFIIISSDLFFSTERFDAKQFNSWFRKNAWQRPVHIYMLAHFVLWMLMTAFYFAFIVPFLPLALQYIAIGVVAALAAIQMACTLYTMSVET